ncbi:MAG: acetolactate decarboxylase [Hyphomicrobiales bacterium]|nr:acetolactate decarboxylase [Hyphomicrobiales bacterium]MCP4998905.1 acetolactate decarboxylase [Hyphomicrobiales bacterium]
MSHRLKCRISDSLWDALQRETARTGDSLTHMVQHALSEALGLEHHSLFQVSTSGAVVKGVFKGCTSVGDLKSHGDFGLGTFEDLDGELIMLDGHCCQAGAGGVTVEAEDSWLVPFATATRFSADRIVDIDAIASLETLQKKLDGLRPSQNIFVGFRIEGQFERIDMRAACKAMPGEGLIEATSHQSEFGFDNIEGTLVGFWTPAYAKAIGVPGYHLHFISSDHSKGGHVLGVKAARLSASLHLETDIHVGIPETTAFLEADLQDDPSSALDVAEKGFVRDR